MLKELVVLNSDKICNSILKSFEYKNSDIILGYYPGDNEVDIRYILEYGISNGKKIAIPRICEDGVNMEFFFINDLKDVEPGKMGIFEPLKNCSKYCFDHRDKVSMIVPGVAFSKTLDRIGYGKGFYDRYLDKNPVNNRIGASYQFQICNFKSDDIYDVKMTKVVTESNIYE